MMMFARRDRIETVPSYYNEYDQPYYDERGFYEPESRNEHGYNDDVYEPMHTKKEDRNTRRQFNRKAQQQDSYNGITDNQPDEDTSSDQLYSDEYVDNEDKYSQFPKRAVESEYASQQTEDEPTVMSRQAKYNKNLKIRILKMRNRNIWKVINLMT